MNKINKCKPMTKAQCKYIKVLANKIITAALGGKYSVSYRMLANVCKEELLKDIELEFGTKKISKLCNCRFKEVIDFITDWFPDDDTMEVSCELEDSLERFIYRIVDDIPKESPAYQEIMEDFINAVRTGSKGLE